MKKAILLSLLISNFTIAQHFHKNEFGAIAGVYTSGKLPNTITYGQQYTHWINKNIGLSIGTFRTNQDFSREYSVPTNFANTKQEAHRYWDFTLKSRFNRKNQSFGVAAGISTDKLFSTEFVLKGELPNYPYPSYDVELNVTTKPVAHFEVNYSYQISQKISGGVFAREYVGSQRAGIYGLNLSYHFSLNPDSIGISDDNKIDFGMVGGGGLVGNLGSKPNGYRVLLPYAGIYFQRKFSLAWDARLEILYARRGFSAREINAGSITYNSARLRADFIQIPVLFENEFIPNWQLFFGPHFSIIVQSDYEVGKRKVESLPSNDLIFGLTAGLSRSINDRLSLETRYALDFLSFSPYTYSSTLNDFRLGLRFRMR